MLRVEKKYYKRQRLVSAIGFVFAMCLVVRLVVIQGFANDAYASKARHQHIKEVSLAAKRGQILDREGRVLATTLESQSFFVNNISDVDTLRSLAVRFSEESGESERSLLKRLEGKRSFVWLARQMIDGPEAENLPSGIGRVVEMTRAYPMGSIAGQLIGYTNIDQSGIEGIERARDGLLSGASGEMSSRVNAKGQPIGDLGVVESLPEDGADLTLTIDSVVQSIAEEELEAAVAHFRAINGIAIVTNPKTGDILAMANVPTVDPNAFGDFARWKHRNRGVTDQFEPGSTFKIVAIAGAIEEGLYTGRDSIDCENGRLVVPGGVITDTHPSKWLTVQQVLEESSNVGTIKIARALGAAGLFKYGRLFGFGSITGKGLPGEVDGILKHPGQWSKRSLETIAIGQEVGVTALQIASAYGVIANRGQLVAPRLYRWNTRGDQRVNESKIDTVRRVVSTKTAVAINQFLEGVVSHGTGSNAAISGYRVAGKTGTAQRAYDDKPGYDPDRYVASFVGYLPAEDPELLCLVIVDGPEQTHLASQVAAPVFKRIVNRVLSLHNTTARHKTTLVQLKPVPKPTIRPSLRLLPDRHAAHRTTADVDPNETQVAAAGQGNRMPNVVGVPLRLAVVKLTEAGFKVKASGSGLVVKQVPSSGAQVRPGTLARVTCRRNG
jgi:cell division protein FtsI (penicillin-binding protein 3)